MTMRCSGLSTFGHTSPITPDPTAASMSRKAWCQGRLMRTSTSAPPFPTAGAAAATSVRARSFSASGTLSSRSRMMPSAPRVCAEATNLSRITGTNSRERQAGRSERWFNMSDDPFGAEGGQLAGIDAEARQDLGRVLAELRGRMTQRARRRRQAGDDVVDGDAADLLVRHFDHDLACADVGIVHELVDVVDRRRRHL